MDPQYEQDTLRAEEDHWWYRGRRRIVRGVVATLELPSSARILDAGCGSGRNMVELSEFGDVTGTDVSLPAIELARERGVGRAELAGLDEMPFADESFDLVALLDVIEHVDDDVGALRELRRVAAADATLLVTVPAYPRLWSSHDVANRHFRRYTRRALLDAAGAAGWTCERTTHFNALLLPPAAAYRAAERLIRRGEAPPDVSELDRTPAWMNGALESVLAAEAAAIRRGRRIPAGLSLLGVFRST
jgi:SAM-dependent methyltransferase